MVASRCCLVGNAVHGQSNLLQLLGVVRKKWHLWETSALFAKGSQGL